MASTSTAPVQEAPRRLLEQYEIMEQVLLELEVEELCVVQRVSTFWRDLIKRSQPIQKKMFLLPEGPTLQPDHVYIRNEQVINYAARLRVNPIVDAIPYHVYAGGTCAPHPRQRRPSRLYPCPVTVVVEGDGPTYAADDEDFYGTEVYQPVLARATWRIYVRVLMGDPVRSCRASHLHRVEYPEAVTRPEASWRKMMITQPPIPAIGFAACFRPTMSLRNTKYLTFGEMADTRSNFISDGLEFDDNDRLMWNLKQFLDEWVFIAPLLFAGNDGFGRVYKRCRPRHDHEEGGSEDGSQQLSETHGSEQGVTSRRNSDAPSDSSYAEYDTERDYCKANEGLCSCQEPLEQSLRGVNWVSDSQRTRPFRKFPSEWPESTHSSVSSELSDPTYWRDPDSDEEERVTEKDSEYYKGSSSYHKELRKMKQDWPF
ncbi:uncharacterized protein RCC_08725 [Ramularia collo-cygni]|uniref:F-box domain-containing protein n=1 Tax=Ramularia collo-cygni TaxID=112498 RepID=A0A2D3VBH0_9PEZI|nr:uncharacterized protein RCC_08725 [Ramularia collo-cygni]CZT23015.1 uncharacterized protein RCC_08725 [Ramularia collo-cygni]